MKAFHIVRKCQCVALALACCALAACNANAPSDSTSGSSPAVQTKAGGPGSAASPSPALSPEAGDKILAAAGKPTGKLVPVTIAQFGHVFLYMPLYVALDRGFFRDEGLDVKLVSTGGDEKTFTAVSTGNAQFGVSDPTFTAIAREHGQGGKVVAAVVRGVPFWLVTFRNDIGQFTSPSQFAGYRVATYTAPSTCYAVMKKILQNQGKPVAGAKIVQGAFGTLPALLRANQADMALEIEPTVSIVLAGKGHIVYSPAKLLGDFAFTGLEVSDAYCREHPDQIQAAVRAIARGMRLIHDDPDAAIAVAQKEFAEVPPPVVRDALMRLRESNTVPLTPVLPKSSWDAAIALRKEIGDMQGSGSYDENVDMQFVKRLKQN